MTNRVMKCHRVICYILLIMALVIPVGCYDLVYQPQDEKNVRRQLHISNAVRLVHMDSSPKTAGFFGREGLSISAVFQFDDKQFSNYMNIIDDKAVWKPVPFISYAPDRADEYSPDALRWSGLPVPKWVESYFKHWEFLPQVLKVKHGKYYGSLIATSQGDRVDHPDGNYHYKCLYVGMSFPEITEQLSVVIATFAVLDMDTKELYAIISFSG